eukprot:TRINITY_DN8971_c0_g1_i1.p1 TRINITY_DN8971_c0_g1~~TRINITY_DN8971_c0_g1_i1.p1  ORF type:complete len:278 (-),score=60.62 TRINITY_DN8971_c0_g1_i1:205-954(-)
MTAPNREEACPLEVLRFITHFLLFRPIALQHQSNEQHQDQFQLQISDSELEIKTMALELYVDVLLQHTHYSNIIPMYIGQIDDREYRIEMFTDFLMDIDDHRERGVFFDLTWDALPGTPEDKDEQIHTITKNIVESIRTEGMDPKWWKYISESNQDVLADSIESDDRKIDSLQWLMFDQSQTLEAVRQCNSLARMFIRTIQPIIIRFTDTPPTPSLTPHFTFSPRKLCRCRQALWHSGYQSIGMGRGQC